MSRGGRPGLRAPNGPYGLCGRNATLVGRRVFMAFESSLYGLCGRKATLGEQYPVLELRAV